jgi:hypothetical protein
MYITNEKAALTLRLLVEGNSIRSTERITGMDRNTILSLLVKKWDNLEAAYNLWFAYYNFCLVHLSIKTTPAMQAGLTDHVWTIMELIQSA